MASLFVIFHLFGVALGAGGAYLSDILFFQSIKNRHISQTELRFLSVGSKMVWIGLFILFFSGLGLFLLDIEKYLASTKFLTKMSIVLIIFLNGLLFEFIHFGHLRFHASKHLHSLEKFIANSPWLMVSGIVSITSWSFALVLGSLSAVPYSYSQIMIFYGLVILVITIVSMGYFKSRGFLGK
ncbi:MAG: hypothetical protein K8Q91_00660 [Candidatus Vogelbacteria bacterium]|nr:hypothetical protein [Candidatus Vogelbacteria bacterium]